MKKIDFKVIYLILFFIVIACFPKFNIINISGSRTGIRLDDIFLLGYCVLLLINILKKGFKQYYKLKKICSIFIICILSFFISNILGIKNGDVTFFLAFLNLVRKIEYFILIFAGYDLYNELKSEEIIKKLFIFTLLFHIIYVCLDYSNIIPNISNLIGREVGDRIYSTFSGPYEFSGYLLLLLPFFYIGFAKEKKLYIKVLNLLYTFIILLGIFISQSRVSLVAGIFIVCFITYFSIFKNKILKLGLPILAFFTIFFCIANPFKFKYLNRISNVNFNSYSEATKIAWSLTDYKEYKKNGVAILHWQVHDATPDLSFAIRITKWTTLIKETLKRPIFGMGQSIVGEAMDGSFVRLFVETGILGLVLWCILLITIVKESHSFQKQNFMIILSLIISLVIGSTFIDIFEASKVMMPFWFIIGFIFSYENNEYYKKDKIKVAHIISGMNYGGVENVIYNYYSNMDNSNFENIVICHSKINKNNSKLFRNYNFKFYEVTPKRDSLLKNYKEIKKILKLEKVDIVHVHMSSSSFVGLIAAKRVGVRVRICHAHTKEELNNKKGKLLKFICNKFANEYMACSLDACNNLFNKKNKKKCIILSNAINLERFNFNKKVRTKLKKELKLTKKHVIGHVGRLSKEKNHEKLINAFKEILKTEKEVHLLLIGNGEYKKEIKEMIKDIKSSVTLIKNADNIEDYYNAMDVFVFPSINEGLGISVVEAQVSGLPCIVSDTVPREVKITKLVRFMKLSKSNKEWADEIVKHFDDERKSYLKETKKSNYNIIDEANKLNNIYNEFYNKYI